MFHVFKLFLIIKLHFKKNSEKKKERNTATFQPEERMLKSQRITGSGVEYFALMILNLLAAKWPVLYVFVPRIGRG